MSHPVVHSKSFPGKYFLDTLFAFLCSIKSAIIVLLSLAVSLGTATILESLYDTPTAQYWVYRSFWFHGILGALGVNIFCVAMSRLPWKRRHIPFLMAHAGILILLFGSLLTEYVGIDGNLRISEGETRNTIELESNALVVMGESEVYSLPITWLPPEVRFKPISFSPAPAPYPIEIDQFISHAEPTVSFIPNLDLKASESANQHVAAIQFKVSSNLMGIAQEFWLWEGSSQWQTFHAGAANFSIQRSSPSHPSNGASFIFTISPEGNLGYSARSSAGKISSGIFKNKKFEGQKIQPGWKGNLSVEILKWIPRATALTDYHPSRIQHGSQAPTSAIHIRIPVIGDQTSIWLGLGDRATMHFPKGPGVQEIGVAYFPKRLILPFSISLDRFTVEHNPGTSAPAAYSSQVHSGEGPELKETTISMNEPLETHGYTIYQASYEEGEPRPTTSIFFNQPRPRSALEIFRILTDRF